MEAAAEGLSDLSSSAKKAGRALDVDLSDGIDKAGAQAGKLGQGLGVLSPTLGGMAMSVADLADGMLALATPQGAVIAGVVALTGAALGGAAALGGIVGGLGALALAADDALLSLDGFRQLGSDFYPQVPPATVRSIREVSAAMDALVSVGQMFTVEIGGNVAGAFAKAGKAAVGLGLEALDAFRKLTDGQSILRSVAVATVSALTEPLVMLLRIPATILEGYVAIADALGMQVDPAMRDAIPKLGTMQRLFAEGAVKALENSDAARQLGALYDDLAARGDGLVQAQIRVNAAAEAGTPKLADLGAEAAAFLAEIETGESWLSSFQKQLDGIVPPRAISALERLNNLEAELQSLSEQGAVDAEIYARAMDRLTSARSRLTVENEKALKQANQKSAQAAFSAGFGAAQQQAGAPSTQDALGMVSSVMGAIGGGVSGLSAAGPVGAVIAAIIQLVTSIVPEQVGQGLLDGIHNAAMEFFGDLPDLVPVLADAMLRSIQEGIPALMQGLSGLVSALFSPEMISMFIEGAITSFVNMITQGAATIVSLLIEVFALLPIQFLSALLDIDTWIAVGKSIADGFAEAVKGTIFGKPGERGAFGEGGTLDQIFVGRRERAAGERSSFGRSVPGRASGDDYIPATGLYMMHRGEVVSGNGRSAPAEVRGGGSAGVTVIVQGSVLGTVEDIARAMREAGRRGVSFG